MLTHFMILLRQFEKNVVLESLLYPDRAAKDTNRMLPGFPKIHKEFAQKGVTLALLWVGYSAQAQAAVKKINKNAVLGSYGKVRKIHASISDNEDVQVRKGDTTMSMDILVHKIRALMEKNKYLKKTIPYFRETKIVRYMLQSRNSRGYRSKAIQGANEKREAFRACYEAHRDEFARVAKMLEDDFSRKTQQAVITYHLTPNPDRKILKPVIVHPQYFPRDILKPVANEVFIDGGIHRGYAP